MRNSTNFLLCPSSPRVRGGLFAASFLAIASLALADSDNFNQANGTDWFEPLNWSLNAPPTAADTATIQSGTAVISGSNAEADALYVQDTLLLNGLTAGLSISQDLSVGSGTSAFLTIQGGATLSVSGNGLVGSVSGGTATAVVTGTGSSWTNGDGFSVGAAGDSEAWLTVSDGAYVSSPGTLRAGMDGIGHITISQSGTVSAGQLEVGQNALGDITVTGASSQLTLNGGSSIGESGLGTLRVQYGGVVTQTGIAFIANGTGGGAAVVDGDGSQWTIDQALLVVGAQSSGTLTVQNGGVVTSGSAEIGSSNATDGRGTVIIDGTNSSWTVSGGLDFQNTGTITVSNGGTLLTATSTDVMGYTEVENGSSLVVRDGGSFSTPRGLLVGQTGTGSFSISNGGTAEVAVLQVGMYGNGSLTVDGANSTLTIDGGSAYFGYSGTATVTVSNGGVVYNVGTTNFALASSSTSSSFTVTGTGSQWNGSDDLFIGQDGGRADLTVSDGGYLSNINATIGGGSSVTITGPSSNWTSNGYLDFSSGTMTVSAGAQVNSIDADLDSATVTLSGTSQWHGSSFYITSSTLSLEEASYLSNGYNQMDNTAVTVSGSSFWDSAGGDFAQSGTLSLTIQDSGTVSWGSGSTLGGDHGQGAISVSGTDSLFSVTQLTMSSSAIGGTSLTANQGASLNIGILDMDRGSLLTLDHAHFENNGWIDVNSGTIVLQNSATASTSYVTVGTGDPDLGGPAQVQITGSSRLTAYSLNVDAGSLLINSGGRLTVQSDASTGYADYASVSVSGTGSRWNSQGNLTIGTVHQADFLVEAGGTLSVANTTYVGHGSTLTIDGVGSAFSSTIDTEIGWGGGTGAFTIQNGATGTSQIVAVGSDYSGTSTLVVDGTGSKLIANYTTIGSDGYADAQIRHGGELDTDDLLVGTSGGFALLSVTGSNSKLNYTDDATVGAGSEGTLSIEQGGQLGGGNLAIGDGGFGTVNVSGPGSRAILTGPLNVGVSDVGVLNISQGGQLSASQAIIGNSSGTASVSGSGSQLSLSGSLVVSNSGDGALLISDGGKVTSGDGFLAASGNGSATVSISGTGSQWLISGGLALGDMAGASLSVTDSGTLSSGAVTFGADGGAGNALVSGTGSVWTVNVATGTAMIIDSNSDGSSLTVDDGGKVDFTGSNKIIFVGTAGSLYVGTGSNAGVLIATSILDNGLVSFNHSDSVTSAANFTVSSSGLFQKTGSGTLTITGTLDNSLASDLALDGGTLQIGNGGTVGTLSGNVTTQVDTTLAFNRSNAVTYAGAISGDGSLAMLGSGTLTLSGANSYNAGTFLQAGLVRVTTTTALPDGGTVHLAGGSLQLANNTASNFSGANVVMDASGTISVDRVSGTANVTHTMGTLNIGSQTLTVAQGTTFGANNAGSLVIGDVLLTGNPIFNFTNTKGTGTGTTTLGALTDDGTAYIITKTGAGTLVFGTAANSLTSGGSLVVNRGIAQVSASDALGGDSLLNVVVNGTAAGTTTTLSLSNGVNQSILSLTFGGNGATSTSTNTVSVGTGTLALAGDVTYDATNNPLGATLSGKLGLGDTSHTFNVGDSTSAATDLTVSAVISGANGGLTKTGAGTLLLSGANTYTGDTEVQSGTLAYGVANALSNSSTVLVSGGVFSIGAFSDTVAGVSLTGGAIVGTTGTLTGNDYEVESGTISARLGGSAILSKSGTGTVLISGTASYTGGTLIDEGTLAFGANNLLSNTGLVSVGGGVLDISTFSDTVGSVLLTSGIIAGTTGTLTGSSYTVQSGTISARLSGTGGLVKATSGLLVMTNTSSYTGGTKINGGTLTLGTASALATSGSVAVNGGTFDIGAFNQTVGMVSLVTGNIIGTTGTLTGSSYAVQSGTISARLGGTGGLTKSTAGTVTLTGANSYSGSTSVLSGTLVAASNGAVGQSVVTVSTGAVFLVETNVSISNTVLLAGGTAAQNFASGGNLAQAVAATSALTGGKATTAEILAGTSSSAGTQTSSFSLTSAATNDGARQSDVLHLTGVPVVSGSTTDIFVLELSISSVAPGSYLAWLDTNSLWSNAVLGNTGNNASASQMGFAGSFATFQSGYGTTLSSYVGAWGTDGTNVWAVLNHNSDFAVVPEPRTIALLAATLGLALALRRRRQADARG